MVGFGDLPPELREIVYGYVVVTDRITVASKALRGGSFLASEHVLVFASAQMRPEYQDTVIRHVIDHRRFLRVNVVDFNFEPYKKFLTQNEKAGTIGRFQTAFGDNPMMGVKLRFSEQFDGTPDRAQRWVRWTQKLSKTHNAELRSWYTVIDSEDSPSIRKFKTTLRFDQISDLPQDSEWRKILLALQLLFCLPSDSHQRYDQRYVWGSDDESEEGDDEGQEDDDKDEEDEDDDDDDESDDGDDDVDYDDYGDPPGYSRRHIDENEQAGDQEGNESADRAESEDQLEPDTRTRYDQESNADLDSEAYTETEDEAEKRGDFDRRARAYVKARQAARPSSGSGRNDEQGGDEQEGDEANEPENNEEVEDEDMLEVEDMTEWYEGKFVKRLIGGDYNNIDWYQPG